MRGNNLCVPNILLGFGAFMEKIIGENYICLGDLL